MHQAEPGVIPNCLPLDWTRTLNRGMEARIFAGKLLVSAAGTARVTGVSVQDWGIGIDSRELMLKEGEAFKIYEISRGDSFSIPTVAIGQ